MTSREQFEGWATNAGFIVTTKNDYYLYPATNSAWQVWQSSREEIVVDLSKMHLLLCDQNDVVSELTKHGLKVKV